MLLVLVLLSAVHGFFRGLLVQVLGAVGILLGIWFATVVLHWVGDRWSGAHPAVVFWALKWAVAVVGGLTLASLATFGAEMARRALGATPFGWIDRLAGVAAGAALTTGIACFLVLLGMQIPGPRVIRSSVAEARISAPLLSLGETLCTCAPWFPGATSLRARFASATRHTAERSRHI